MPVPLEVRQVPRPTNTVVIDSMSGGRFRYAVLERKKSVCKPGKNPSPRNGRTIGHIIDLQYVPKDPSKKLSDKPAYLSYGSAALAYSTKDEILPDLLNSFEYKDAITIFVMACLKVIYPEISNYRLKQKYEECYLSKYFQNVALSKNSICSFVSQVGNSLDQRVNFFRIRANKIDPKSLVLIDGMLKKDDSKINTLSRRSRKFMSSGYKDISVIVTYDYNSREPISAHVVSGNIIDAKAYKGALEESGIKQGIIVCDKGFPPSEIKNILAENTNLKYLTPIQSNRKLIITHNMLRFNDVIKGINDDIWCKKAKISDNTYLYSFRDPEIAYTQEKNHIKNGKKNKKLNENSYENRKDNYGVVVFQSNIDDTPQNIYKLYKERWNIELLFRAYKNQLMCDTTKVQSNSSVIGEEFINYISSIIASKIIKKAEDCGILDEMTFGNMLDDLSQCLRFREASDENFPNENDNVWQNVTINGMELMRKLNLVSFTPPPEKKKRGRKPKNENRIEENDNKQEEKLEK